MRPSSGLSSQTPHISRCSFRKSPGRKAKWSLVSENQNPFFILIKKKKEASTATKSLKLPWGLAFSVRFHLAYAEHEDHWNWPSLWMVRPTVTPFQPRWDFLSRAVWKTRLRVRFCEEKHVTNPDKDQLRRWRNISNLQKKSPGIYILPFRGLSGQKKHL